MTNVAASLPDLQGGARPADAQARLAMAVALLSALAYMVVASNLPVAIFGGAGHDDAWFWQRADAIANGSWLGRYDQYTLMKGSGYPLFLAVVHLLGVPLTVAQALLYAIACLLLGHAVYRIGGRPWPALLMVLAMQWHPAALSWNRVLRDNVSAAQVLLVLACVLHMLWVARSCRGRLAWATLGGLTLAWFQTTREDGIWLLPGLAFLAAVAAWSAWRGRMQWRPLLASSAWMACVFAAWLALVATANGIKYGGFDTVDFGGSAFDDAVAALQGVREGGTVPFVPVPARAREEAYLASPSFARLQPALEGGLPQWTLPGCEVYPHSCGDYAGGWFIWALRDAAASVGAYESAQAAEAFYAGLAAEIDGACEAGRLDCERGLAGLMPAVTAEQWAMLPASLWSAARLLGGQGLQPLPYRSQLDHPSSAGMWRFLGRPGVPDERETLGRRVAGWFHDPDGGWIRGRCDPDGEAFAIERRPSGDVARYFDDPTAAEVRFAFRLPEDLHCVLELESGAGAFELPATAEPARSSFGAAELQIDDATGIPPRAADVPAWPQAVRRVALAGYAFALPWLALAGLLAFLVAAARMAVRRRPAGGLLVLAACGWGLVASRALLLAVVDISAFPAVNPQYMQPAFPLLVMAAVASLAALLEGGQALSSSGTLRARRSGPPAAP